MDSTSLTKNGSAIRKFKGFATLWKPAPRADHLRHSPPVEKVRAMEKRIEELMPWNDF